MNTIRIPLNPRQIQHLQDYHNWVEKKSNELDLTDYWKTHTEKISIAFESDAVTLTGESGFYFPKPANNLNRLRHFMAQLPINLSFWNYIFFRKLFNRPYDFLTSYAEAYNRIRKHDPVLRWDPSQNRTNWKELQNKTLNFNTIPGMKKKWPASKTHILSDTTIKSYFYLQLIENEFSNLKNSTVCEIGAGTGNMASLFFHHFNNKIFLIDLPKTLFLSFAYLAQTCPNARIALPNEIEEGGFNSESYDIIMLTPQQTSTIKNKDIDLVLNIHSMQEMNIETIQLYFDLVDRIIKPQGYFFCANRMEKIMNGKAIRFLNYPWRSNTQEITFEPDPIMQLVNIYPSYIRMEKYP